MKTWLSMLGLLILGTALGITLAVSQFPPVPKLLADMEMVPKSQDAGMTAGPTSPTATSPGEKGATGATAIAADQEKPQPKIQVDEEIHDFGVMEDSETGHHEFILENVGTAPLTIKVASTTCKCTKGEVEKERIYPGEKTNMILEWVPKGYTGDFSQTATLSTNDPARSSVDLKVKGRVHAPMAIVPRTMLFGQITNREAMDGSVRLYLFEEENAQIEKIKCENENTEPFFVTGFEKLSPEEVQAQPDAKAGYRINITLKPGMAQGPIHQTAKIVTNSEKLGEIDLPIEGKVVGSISVYGAGWDDDHNVFRLGIVDGKQGLKKNLTIVIRHLDGQPEMLRIASVSPSDILHASLSKPITGTSGKVTHAKLSIEIPPGTPASNYIGSQQAPYGHLFIETDRPDGPKLDIRVSFVVENR